MTETQLLKLIGSERRKYLKKYRHHPIVSTDYNYQKWQEYAKLLMAMRKQRIAAMKAESGIAK